MRLLLDPSFAAYTDGIVGCDIEGETLEQVFMTLFQEFPRLLMHLSDPAVAARTVAKFNDRYLEEMGELASRVGAADTLELTQDVPEGAGKAGAFIGGLLMMVVGAVLAFTPLAGGSAYLESAGYSMMIGGIVSVAAAGIGLLLAPTPYLPSVSSPESSPTLYGFDNIKNTTEPGTSVSIVYGTRRVGGHILGMYVEFASAGTVLLGHLGLCEGPVSNIYADKTRFNTLPVTAYTLWGLTPFKGACTPIEEPTKFAAGVNAWADIFSEASLNAYTTASLVPGLLWNYHSNGVKGVFGGYIEAHIEGVESFAWTGVKGTITGLLLNYTATIYCDVYYTQGSTATRIGGIFAAGKCSDSVSFSYSWEEPIPLGAGLRIIAFGGCSWSAAETTKLLNMPVLPYPTVPYDTTTNDFQKAAYMNVSGIMTSNATSTFNFNDKVANTTSFNTSKRLTTTPTTYDTETSADTVRIIISAPILYTSDSSGALNPYTVYYTVIATPLYSLVETLSQEQITAGTLTFNSDKENITGKSKSEVVAPPTTITGLSPNIRYRITVVRRVDESTDMRTLDAIYLKEVTEELHGDFIYPYTARLGFGIAATEQLSGAPPTIDTLIDGMLVSVPEGYNGSARSWTDLTKTAFPTEETAFSFTNNPAYILYDLLTNKRVGLGENCDFTVNPATLAAMQSNFIAMANKCDELAYNAPNQIKRFACDLIINNNASAREWLGAITQTMRASLYYSGGGLFVDIDGPGKLITQIFNQSNLKDFTLSCSTRKYPNAIEVQFSDDSNDYANTVIMLEDPELQTNPSLERRPRTISLPGVTNKTRALALARYTLLLGKYCPLSITFKTGTEGLLSSIGDLIGVHHDTTEWGYGGRVTSYDAATRTIVLDTPFLTDSSKSYVAKISPRTGTTGLTEAALSSVVDDTRSLVLAAVPDLAPAEGDLVIFGETTGKIKPFRIMSIKRSDVEEVELTAIQYNEDLYTAAETGNWGSITDDTWGSTVDVPFKASVSNVKAEVKYYQDSAGAWKTGVEVWYTAPSNSTVWTGAVLNWALTGSSVYEVTVANNSGYFFIPEITTSGDYTFIVTSVYTKGKQTIQEALADQTNQPYAYTHVDIYIPNDAFLSGVTGLTIENSANDGTFVGKDCVVIWRPITVIDAALNSTVGDVLTAPSASNWFSHYVVDISNPDGSIRRSTSGVQTERFVYTHEMNHSDVKIARQFNVTVTAVDRVGRVSNPVTLLAYNPAPSVIS